MLRDGYNVQFEGTIVRTTEEPTLLRENNIQRDQGWSWIVLFAAFLTLFITNGMHASFGILYAALISHFDSGREETAWIGSISLGLLCFFSPVASVLIEQIGCRATSIIGAFLCSLGFLLSSFATGITLLYFSHGLLFGLGTSLTYTAAMTVVTRSFERRRNIATGLCTSGSQFGGISLAPLSQVLFDRLGYANTFRTFAGLLLVVAISSLAYRSELGGNTSRPTSAKKSPKEMLNVWKSKPYIVWALGTTMVTLGYNIPRYTLAKYATDQGISRDASAWLVSYLCASSAIGRITFGRLCEWIPNLYLCQACIIGCALSAFLYPFLKSYLALVITAIIFGLPDGGFVASLSVVTMEIVGPEKMVEGFGFMLFCQSYSNVIGPPLSGMLYDTYKSYKAAFCFAAVPEIIGALMLFLIPYYRRNQVKYTHEIEYGSNSGILGNEAASTINPISEVPILPTAEPQGEYNVVINLTSDSPDVHLVNVILHRTGGTETTGVTCNDGEADKNNITQIQDGGIINKAVQEIEIPVCTGESSTLASEDVNPVDQPGTESRGASVVICNEPESNTMLSAVATGPMKSSSTQTVIHDGEIHYTNNQTVNEDRILPSVLSSQISATTARENENQIIDVGVELTEAVQAFPSTQLVAIVSNDTQTDGRQNFETTDMINLGLQIKKSNKSLPLEDSASVGRVVSNTVSLSEGYENQVEEIIHLQTEQDVPKISPPPQHKHHVNNIKVDVHHVAKADVTTMDCHDNVVDSSPEAILAELDTLVQGSELTSNPLATPFTADVNNQQPSLMKCTGLESGLTQLEPSLMKCTGLESGLSQNQESLMLSNTFIPEMTISCVSTAFSTEPSHMSGINDVLTQKQLPEPLKPTSLSSVRGNEQQSCNSQDVPPATSPLSCELSTVIADVIQSLTSQQSTSQKSNKESSISSNMADNPQENAEYTDQPEKKQDIIVVEMPTTKELKFGINVESSSQASSELSSYYKLQTSVLHSMQSIVAEGCPEDIALLEDISIDLTLDKDPSFASIVLIDDVDEQNNTTDLNFPCLSHEPAITPSSGISGQEQGFLGVELSTKHPSIISTQEQHFASGSQDQHFSGLSYEPAIITSSVVSCQLTHEPTSARPSVIPTQKFPAHEASIARPSAIPNQEQPFLDLTHEPAIITCSVVSSQVSHGPALQQFSSLSSGQVHKHTNAYPGMISSQDQHATALKQEPGIISSSLASSQLPHEPTKTHPSVISTQGGNFPSVVQEPILTNLSPISCQEQHFPGLKQTTNFPCSIVHEPAITLPVSSQGQHFGLPHESNIVNPTDTIALELFSHPAGHDGDIYDGAKSHEQIAKPIESTNPFYQDINQ